MPFRLTANKPQHGYDGGESISATSRCHSRKGNNAILHVHNPEQIARVWVQLWLWLVGFGAPLASGVACMGELEVWSSHISAKEVIVIKHFCARFPIAPHFHL
jgi:hypothetical protein